ncbi:MAG: single-stranded DNA-binding protein [Elusimicrobiota bacterium]|jgi:single-strand DNA-binding protein|nr:single-stranded DNA-binding protein [Elusimicrobiota bacterium]
MSIRLPEINYILISGRLTRDADVRMTQKGSVVCGFDVAVNRRYMDTVSGEWKDDVAYVPVSLFGPQAERLKDRLKKGAPVVVDGRINMNEFTDKAGQNRKILRVIANRVQVLPTADNAAGGDAFPAREAQTAPAADAVAEDDVPF